MPKEKQPVIDDVMIDNYINNTYSFTNKDERKKRIKRNMQILFDDGFVEVDEGSALLQDITKKHLVHELYADGQGIDMFLNICHTPEDITKLKSLF